MVHLDLSDTAMRFAFSFAVDEAGWSRTAGPARDVTLVADRLTTRPDAPPLDVLVLAPSPVASQRAIEAFTAGRVRAVVSSGSRTRCRAPSRELVGGLSVLSTAIVEAAQRFPTLSGRLERTLHLVIRGRPNREIARELHQSEATTKRDIAELLRRFDATNRVALAATALRLGLPADGRS